MHRGGLQAARLRGRLFSNTYATSLANVAPGTQVSVDLRANDVPVAGATVQVPAAFSLTSVAPANGGAASDLAIAWTDIDDQVLTLAYEAICGNGTIASSIALPPGTSWRPTEAQLRQMGLGGGACFFKGTLVLGTGGEQARSFDVRLGS
jgi:hypothetical protein